MSHRGDKAVLVMAIPNCKKTKTVTRILSPLSWKSFLDSHYEKTPFYLPPSLDRLQLIQKSSWTEDSVYQSQRSGKTIPAETIGFLAAQNQYVSARKREKLLKTKSYKAFVEKEKGSILLHHVQNLSPPWSKVTQEFTRAFGAPAQLNGYITPPNEQTYARHWDDHDVFVFQISGRKKWDIHAPLIWQPLTPVTDCPRSKKQLSIVLEPGSLLYIPKGFPHSAKASDSTSFHLTLGLMGLRNFDVLLGAVQQILLRATEDPYFRRTCNRLDRGNPKLLKQLFPDFLERIGTYLSPADIEKIAKLSESRRANPQAPSPKNQKK